MEKNKKKLTDSEEWSYKKDLQYFYNMTEEDANQYYKQLKFNEHLIESKIEINRK